MSATDTDWRLVAARARAETFVRHVEHHAEIGSTSDRALELAGDAALPTPALILAEQQNAGRGRGSNVWRSGLGALTFSLVIERPPGLRRERVALLSLVAGLAVRDTIAAAAPGRAVRVKWPNDVYLGDRKVCGILVEVPPTASDRIVVGIGVNVNNSFDEAPEEVRRRATALFEATGQTHDLAGTLVDLLVRLEAAWDELGATGELPVSRWSAHCLLTGRHVRLRTPAGEVAGECLGVSEDGELLLETADGVRPLRAGEVIAY